MFHLARHTFVTIITLMNGMPIESISKMLVHTKLRAIMIYAKVTQRKLAIDMAMLQPKMNENE
jgi:site-specific recombinase XerD